MSKSFTLQVTVQVDVQNAENLHQAREAAFALLSSPHPDPTKKGRPASTTQKPKATVTGVQIQDGETHRVLRVPPLSEEDRKKLESYVKDSAGKVTVLPDVNVFSFTHPTGSVEVTESSP